MNNTRHTIVQIIYAEFLKLVNLIENDFYSNYKRKSYNFLLNQMDSNMLANMVFVSSFESKSGFAIEACAKQIAALKYGNENVPSIVNPRHLPVPADLNSKSQIVLTDVDTNNGALRGEIAAFRASNMAYGTGSKRVESRVNQQTIKQTLLPLSSKYKVTDKTFTKPVDLAFYDGINWNVMELKAGGDLDSSNAPSNIEKLLNIYVDMGIENCKVYFVALYNKDGEGNTWTGAVKKHIAYPEMFLIGKTFWEKILPDNISFEDFESMYQLALEEIDLNGRIKIMLNNIRISSILNNIK